VGVSWRTAVSEKAAFRAFYVVARGLFFNRWGGNLAPEYTNFVRPPDHPTVFTADATDFTKFYPETQAQTGERPLVGGYHDAGDFDQRPMHTVVPELLMRAYELNPSLYSDGQLNIPEGGNGIPDILDEALWGIAAWEALQEADGGVRQGVESFRHPWGYYHADDDPLIYWTYSEDADVSARAAGIFAQASRLLHEFDPDRGDELERNAEAAFRYAQSNSARPNFVMYGAGELYRLTGDAAYQAAFKDAWNAMGPYGAFSNMALNHLEMTDYMSGGKRVMPDYFLAYVGAPGETGVIEGTNAFTWMGNYAAIKASDVIDSEHAQRNPRPMGYNMTWGQATNAGKYLDTIVARMQMGDLSDEELQGYFDALSLAADYMLGCNPAGTVFITGLGSRRIEEPLHLDALSFIKEGKGLMPGIPSYGLIDSFPGAYYSQAAGEVYYPAFDDQPKGLRYSDARTVVQSSEFAVWDMQAPLAEFFAILIGEDMDPSVFADEACGIDACMLSE
jgi:endoglucanase